MNYRGKFPRYRVEKKFDERSASFFHLLLLSPPFSEEAKEQKVKKVILTI